jgi:hypothetical protein
MKLGSGTKQGSALAESDKACEPASLREHLHFTRVLVECCMVYFIRVTHFVY